MKLWKLTSIAVLATACGSALAEAPEGDMPPPPGRMMDDGPMGPGPGGRGPGRAASVLRHVKLDDAQDDKVFAIVHAQEPQRREQARTLHQSHEALRALALSGQYDEGKAAALAKSAGAAAAALALLEARTEARILAVLTPEQRREADTRMERRHPRLEK